MKRLFPLCLCFLLAACSGLGGGLFARRDAASAVRDGSAQTHPSQRPDPGPGLGAPQPGARTAEALDTTTPQERAKAVAVAGVGVGAGVDSGGGQTDLGRTIASLGAVGEPGIWLKTPLVGAPARGRVEYPEKGTAVAVDLIPLDAAPGAGSRISLAAMRLIGADLTALPELRVFRLN